MTDAKAPTSSELKRSTIAPALLAPVIGGAILYYSLRKTPASDIANFANRMSFVGFGLWIIIYVALSQLLIVSADILRVLQFGSWAVLAVGVVLAIIVTGRIKKSFT